jgi:hypothetical protein
MLSAMDLGDLGDLVSNWWVITDVFCFDTDPPGTKSSGIWAAAAAAAGADLVSNWWVITDVFCFDADPPVTKSSGVWAAAAAAAAAASGLCAAAVSDIISSASIVFVAFLSFLQFSNQKNKMKPERVVLFRFVEVVSPAMITQQGDVMK